MYMDKEIKKAISHFKRVIAGLKYLDKASISDDSLKDYIKVRNERNHRRFQASRIAVEALREQAERGKGCEFCCYTEYPDEKLYPKEGYAFYAGFSKQVDVDAFDEDEVEKISYCPICGRKLEEAPSDWTKNKACRDAVLKTFGGKA